MRGCAPIDCSPVSWISRLRFGAPPPAQRCLLYTPPEPACSSTVSSFMNVLLVPLADRDHQVQLGMARKMIDIRLAIRSVMVQCLHHLLIRSDDHDVWPNVEFSAASHRMRLVGHPLATAHV